MGNMLSFILDIPVRYKRIIFLDIDFQTVSSMVCRGETVLDIESKTQASYRVLLNGQNLINLQNIEWCIFETITQKTSYQTNIATTV